jgi:hypothetical protein
MDADEFADSPLLTVQPQAAEESDYGFAFLEGKSK